MVPLQLRVGGAFMALALALFLFGFIAMLRGQALFDVTPQFLFTCLAAVIFGAFATTRRDQAGSRAQVIALAVAVALIGIGMILPSAAVAVTQTYWLALWGGGALLCALILRRSAM